jgi:HSP20 family molecular chaperone IbpA
VSKTVVHRQKNEAARTEQTRLRRRYSPGVDILETPEELVVEADMPGARAGDIDIHFENGVLTIHARVAERQPEGARYLLREYGSGDFYRTFEVNESIDVQRLSAAYEDGVLTLHLPKVEAAKPRKIAVKTS